MGYGPFAHAEVCRIPNNIDRVRRRQNAYPDILIAYDALYAPESPVIDKQPAHTVFFPLAAAYAMLALPASLLAMRDGSRWLPGLASPTGHGHEMLFGFALAVVAGFLVTRIARRWLYALAGLWLLARLTYLAQPDGIAATAANIGFAASVWG